ncbi:Oidioi.mRNA.OKI2018_I69.YSR.g17198.t1.cds [Oikopleura dioica]|uniref:Oidioi.mRNA.OKI2018_I69.YSR.g17198.t1.cds n=1 Tax=Oikopleura dioica TaxID=34765 RepID=A0ABN7SQP9_OIKDI|nr:Oidioi.mRNA.OKI2018_I69.YSR.g17198.t1.cds [Oikopleura dioica]
MNTHLDMLRCSTKLYGHEPTSRFGLQGAIERTLHPGLSWLGKSAHVKLNEKKISEDDQIDYDINMTMDYDKDVTASIIKHESIGVIAKAE